MTWSFDPDEFIWLCGVLDPSITEPDVVDGLTTGQITHHHRVLNMSSLSRVKRWF